MYAWHLANLYLILWKLLSTKIDKFLLDLVEVTFQ